MKIIITMFALFLLTGCATNSNGFPRTWIETNINRNGLDTRWYANGQRKLEANFTNGKIDGLATWWYEDGQIKLEANFTNGQKNGLATWWYEDGQRRLEENWKDGSLEKSELFTLRDKYTQKQKDWWDIYIQKERGKGRGLLGIYISGSIVYTLEKLEPILLTIVRITLLL